MASPLSATDVQDLRGRVSGQVITRSDPGYDAARSVWNAMIDRHPLVVVRVGSAADVAPTIAFARDRGLELAVRGAGHNVAGHGTVDGGVVVDMGDLNAVTVDASDRSVRVEGGATLKDLDAATQAHGLAVPVGVVSGTGVAGLTLGGGVGWLTRPHGLTVDNLLGVELVTAEGEVVHASDAENPELLWAHKGGGGNFGVVTAFTFRAHPVGPQVLAGAFVYGVDNWPRAWRALADWTTYLPDEMTTITTTLTPPPEMEMGDQPVLMVGFAWASPDRLAGAGLVDRLRKAAPPDAEEVGDVSWVQWQSAFDELVPRGVRAYWRNASFARLDDDVIDVLIKRGREQTWVGTAFDVHHLGGAYGRVPEGATPFPNRGADFWINIYGFWTEATDDDARVAFVRGMSADLEPFTTGGHYVNFQGHEQAGHRVLDPGVTFGPGKHARLVKVKRRFDPDNVFHVNHNIDPA
jgi:FAD/FMN-containing dehydrogenase